MLKLLLTSLSIALAGFTYAQELQTENLSTVLFGFEHPQDSTRTKVWWFHGETETTREGITSDLGAFKKAGIGGVVYYDQSHGKAENALDGFSPEWWKILCPMLCSLPVCVKCNY